MKVKNISLELIKYGASAGMRAAFIMLSSDADHKTSDEVIAMLKSELSQEMYEALLLGQLHLVFKGDGIDAAHVDNREDIMEFLQQGLSQASLDFQVKVLKKGNHELRPPFIEIVTTGESFTGKDMFFENFNYVICEPTSLDEPEQAFAFVEISKHTFSTFIFKITTADDWTTIKKNFIDPGYVTSNLARIFLVPADGTKTEMKKYLKEAVSIALAEGVRCGNHLGIAV